MTSEERLHLLAAKLTAVLSNLLLLASLHPTDWFGEDLQLEVSEMLEESLQELEGRDGV